VIEQKYLYVQNLRYKRFAYCIIRDAIAFYFGIPKLFAENDYIKALDSLIAEKLSNLEKAKKRPLTEREINKCKRLTERLMASRLEELTTDFNHCKDVLFKDNVWLQLLDVNAEVFKTFLDTLPEHTKDELAVVPKWSTRDHSLGRPYINDNFKLTKIVF
jgi:hypothetical protein